MKFSTVGTYHFTFYPHSARGQCLELEICSVRIISTVHRGP